MAEERVEEDTDQVEHLRRLPLQKPTQNHSPATTNHPEDFQIVPGATTPGVEPIIEADQVPQLHARHLP